VSALLLNRSSFLEKKEKGEKGFIIQSNIGDRERRVGKNFKF
jgi:hypothetical protein